jgi:hypothetical protein
MFHDEARSRKARGEFILREAYQFMIRCNKGSGISYAI